MATVVDLNHSGPSSVACDICIVGAGAAGLYLANRLAETGLHVVVLEAGGLVATSGESIGIEPSFSASLYRGATEGRAFGWGGSTSRWGGLLVPHSELDLRDAADADAAAWTHIVEVVRERASAVFVALGLGPKTDFETLPDARLPTRASAELRRSNISVMAGEFLPFLRRNLTYLLPSKTIPAVTVYLNAVVATWAVAPGSAGRGKVTHARAQARSGRTLDVAARNFVIAAGAIESARILLEIDRASGERMIPRTAAVGRYLADHLSCTIATVNAEHRARAASLFGPVFVRGRMRSFRFVAPNERRTARKHFAHFIFELDTAGFRFAKDVLSKLQAGTVHRIRFLDAPSAFSDLFALGYQRFLRSRLRIPRGTPAHLQLDIEQAADRDNRVRLGDHADTYGRPVATIDWRVTEADERNIQEVAAVMLKRWPQPVAGFPELTPVLRAESGRKPHDAYHPVGTCKMGVTDDATVDLDLRVVGTVNLFVLSTGVLPGAGTANPTFSTLCLGDRLAERLTPAR